MIWIAEALLAIGVFGIAIFALIGALKNRDIVFS
jgi:hypothetical protein